MVSASSSVRHTRVSRETRRLLAAAAIAFLLLTVLARIRFPDRPPSANPVAPVLTQLGPRRALSDLAAELGTLQRRLAPFVVATRTGETGLRALPDAVATWMPEAAGHAGAGNLIARDQATGLALVLPEGDGTPFDGPRWTPDDLSEPAFLVGVGTSAAGLVLEPLYVAALRAEESAVWSGPLWIAAPETTLRPGTLLFSTDAELAGLAVLRDGAPAIVPANTLLAAVRRLRASPAAPSGWLGVDVQPLTADLAAAVGVDGGLADGGLIVSWVAPDGPGSQRLRPGETIETINGNAAQFDQWLAIAGRIRDGETITLGVRRGGQVSDVTIVAAPSPQARAAGERPRPLGLTLRRVPAGAEVVDVAAPSAASAAGLKPGDVIHLAGAIVGPTPAQVRTAFQDTEDQRPLLVGITRGDHHQVLTLPR